MTRQNKVQPQCLYRIAQVTKRLPLLDNKQYVDLIKESRVNAGLPVDPTIVQKRRYQYQLAGCYIPQCTYIRDQPVALRRRQ